MIFILHTIENQRILYLRYTGNPSGAFALIVIPWLAAIFSIKGIAEIILLTQRWKVKQFTKFVFNSFKDDHHFKMNAYFYDTDDDDDKWDIAKHGNRKDPIQLFVNSSSMHPIANRLVL